MDTDASIYPIRSLYFECNGCGAQWMLRVDPPITSVEEFHAFTKDPERMESCPRRCGARTCSVAWRLGPGTADPFQMFDRKEKPRGE